MEEIWRTIKDFEMYMVSNWGRVKSLKCGKEKILKPIKLKNGYFIVNLYKKSKSKTFHIHILVFDAFSEEKRNGRILQVDHRNNDKTDNRIENLQLLNCRKNSSKGKLQKEKTSKFTGVSLHKQTNKWVAQIEINKKKFHLGLFNTELEASQAYLKAEENLK